ncbi:Aldo-ket-red domain-containing protein [Mycena venus]|uniref:Aldo-ket-red domain-containing protein n=1 Tax=Mycena venus TaxID=2733690 RepID=A0A8H7CI20_9AGAR|nr:Aldo-ket-red domain-containing protein [Mycena venus]
MTSTNENPQKSALNIVMGAMTFGAEGKEGARVHDLNDVESILDAFLRHGHKEIDSARTYCGGTSEEYLGSINWQAKGLLIETKLSPRLGITHSPEDLRKHLMASLSALNAKTLEMWYLHAPDRSVPYEVTLKAVNELYQEGYFKRFGISNFASWEVAEIVGICKANGYIQPTAYQGIYNAIHRAIEPELIPCLRKFGINTFLSTTSLEAGSRFDPERNQGQNYRNRYWNEPYFKALATIRPVVEKHQLTMAEVALRWISHHSLLKREYRDAVLIGASSLEHIEQNLVDLEKGPLPDEVVQVLGRGLDLSEAVLHQVLQVESVTYCAGPRNLMYFV